MNRCRFCGQKTGAPEWKARKLILWRNQYGEKVRVFCDHCGATTDMKALYLSNEDDVFITVIKKPTNPLYEFAELDTLR